MEKSPACGSTRDELLTWVKHLCTLCVEAGEHAAAEDVLTVGKR
eukprot:SAG31_NODE_15433_length_755_cov_1.332317_1_plen_43_part_01